MNKEIVLTELEIVEIKDLAEKARKSFGVYDVPIANDLFMLLEQAGLTICQYPFPAVRESHTDANITRFELENETLTFIGLNTAIFFDEQIFALAHEYYHYLTKTGKAYHSEIDEEDGLTEKKADRFAAEFLLPSRILYSRVVSQFKSSDLTKEQKSRLLRFIARLQNEWWLPYRSIVLRLYEEHHISKEQYETLFEVDARDEESAYAKFFMSIAPDCYKMLNTRTMRTDISSSVIEIFIQNYEEGFMTDDEFASLLKLFGKSPDDFGFDLAVDSNDLKELQELFEGGGADES